MRDGVRADGRWIWDRLGCIWDGGSATTQRFGHASRASRKNLDLIKGSDSAFMRAFHDKGRLSPLLKRVPVLAVLAEDIGQRGAHLVAFRLLLKAQEEVASSSPSKVRLLQEPLCSSAARLLLCVRLACCPRPPSHTAASGRSVHAFQIPPMLVDNGRKASMFGMRTLLPAALPIAWRTRVDQSPVETSLRHAHAGRQGCRRGGGHSGG